jgi:hypothetical protein
MQSHGTDQHVVTHISVSPGTAKLRIRVANDFGVSYQPELPQLGSPSEGLRILSESWTDAKDELTLSVSGSPERDYELSLFNPSDVSSVDGAELVRDGATAWLHIQMPVADTRNAAHETITIHFVPRGRDKSRKHN